MDIRNSELHWINVEVQSTLIHRCLEAGLISPSVQSVHTCGFSVHPGKNCLRAKNPRLRRDPTQPSQQRKATMVVDVVFRQHTMTPRLPLSCPRPVQWRLLHSCPFLHRRRPVSPQHFGSSSCAQCGPLCLCVPAGVAVRHLWPPPCRMRKYRSWGDVVRCWRMLLPVSARKLGGRVWDMVLGAFNQLDGRRLEIVVDGLPLWGGSQLAIDTTMASPLSRSEGLGNHPREGLVRQLVVFGVEVGGHWSAEASVFLRNSYSTRGASLDRGSGSCCEAPSLGQDFSSPFSRNKKNRPWMLHEIGSFFFQSSPLRCTENRSK